MRFVKRRSSSTDCNDLSYGVQGMILINGAGDSRTIVSLGTVDSSAQISLSRVKLVEQERQ
jgi:hypothetical protein